MLSWRILLLGLLCAPLSNAETALEKRVRTDVIAEVAAEAEADKMPAGFGGAKWLMNPAEVQQARPNVKCVNETTYLEVCEYLGRKANVHYIFDGPQQSLLMVLISFIGNSTDQDYQTTHKILVGRYGDFPDPARSETFEKEALRKKGRFSINHAVKRTLGVNVEQILIYRNDG